MLGIGKDTKQLIEQAYAVQKLFKHLDEEIKKINDNIVIVHENQIELDKKLDKILSKMGTEKK